MKIQKEYLAYAAVVLAAVFYLAVVENVYGKRVTFSIGGQDHIFSAFDIILVSISVLASALVVISFLAYKRKPDRKLFIISIAFLLFTLKGVLEVLDNFFLAGYSFFSILKRVLELLILLAFLFVLFKK